MTADQAIRIECIKAAVATIGNPNHVTQAREYYEFVTELKEAPAEVVEETMADEDTTTKTNARKGSRK